MLVWGQNGYRIQCTQRCKEGIWSIPAALISTGIQPFLFLLSYVPLPDLAMLLSWAIRRQQTMQLFTPDYATIWLLHRNFFCAIVKTHFYKCYLFWRGWFYLTTNCRKKSDRKTYSVLIFWKNAHMNDLTLNRALNVMLLMLIKPPNCYAA